MRERQAGFTLIELLVTLAIIGILSAILIPNLLAARHAAIERSAQAYARNVYSVAVAHLGHRGELVSGDCTNGYVAGTYSLNAPGSNIVAACTVSDPEDNQLPVVEVTSGLGTVYTLP